MTIPVKPPTEEPRYIRLNDADNVAIIVNAFGMPAGTRFADGLTLKDFVPQGHKVALVDIADGAPIRRYGEIIGYAIGPIPAGSWVEESRVRMPEPPEPRRASSLRPACRRPAAARGLYVRRVSATQTARSAPRTSWRSRPACNASPARSTLRSSASRPNCCRNIQNVDDVVGDDACLWLRRRHQRAASRIFRSARCKISPSHPNFGGEVMVVGLGCEKLLPERLLPDGKDTARPASCGCRTRPHLASAP